MGNPQREKGAKTMKLNRYELMLCKITDLLYVAGGLIIFGTALVFAYRYL